MTRVPYVLAATLLAAGALAPFAAHGQQQDFGHCGAVTLIFMNPDLRVRDDGYVHASGTFFIQFQAIGERAGEVAKLAFSFGKPLPEPVVACDTLPEPLVGALGPLTGAYVDSYRADSDPTDGFFVPVNTTLVPDGEYAAAVTAYDAGGNYIAQFYTKALVENGPNCFPTLARCEDRTAPWPIVLPGDGNQTNADGGITIEFAELVADVLVRVNGEQVIPEPWQPPARDDDAVPDNDDQDCSGVQELTDSTLGVNNLVCHRTVWGSGFRLAREAQPGDVIEVRALDLAGNEATKVVNVGGATQGGAIQLLEPELQLSASSLDQEVEAGQTAEWRLQLVNVGQGEAEARMTVQAPNGTVVAWSSPTVTVPPGSEQFVTLRVTPDQATQPGRYTLLAKATYKSGTDDKEQQLALNLQVTEYRPVPESPLRRTRADPVADAETADEGAAGKNTPGVAPLAALGVLAVAALAARSGRPRP